MKKNKFGAVIIYVIFLLTISLVLATIIFDSFVVLKNENYINSIESDLYLDMNEKFILSTESSDYYNSNGSGFTDVIGCPKNVSMSGTTSSAIISTYEYYSGGVVSCSGSYLGDNVKISFHSSFTDLDGVLYKGESLALNVGTQINTFSDVDSTIIDVTASAYNFPDAIDDNMNNDNYLPSSEGNTKYYNNFQDDDALGRLEINGYVTGVESKNIFWSNTEIAEYIDNNANNYEGLNTRLSAVSSGVLFLEVNTGSNLRLLEIDKNAYDTSKDILLQAALSGSILAGSGYIQNNAGVLSLSALKTGNEYDFDFVTKDYALFLETTSSGVLKYNLKGEDVSGTKIYIVPLNDSSENELSFLGNNMLERNGIYIGKTQELKKYLQFGDGAGSSYVVEDYLTGKRWSDGSYARTCFEYRFPDAGSDYRYLGSVGDGYYWLNPGGVGTFEAYCDMTGGGWTKAFITPSAEFQVIGIENMTLLNTFTYDLTQAQIEAVRPLSTQFSQFFKKRCYRSIVYNGNAGNQVKWRTWGSDLLSGKYFPNYDVCDDHNYDPILPVVWYESSGYSDTGSYLPITEIHGGDAQAESPPGTPSEDSYYQFGDFYMR